MSKRSQMCSSSENVAEMSAPFLLATARMSALSMLMGAASESTIVGVTDSEMSPINQMSNCSLLVRSEMISFVDSLAAPMSMLNALILAVANKKGADISATFSELEHIWERFDIFGKIEDE